LRLLLLGGGEVEEELRAQARQLGIDQRVVITGMIANGYRYLPALDVFVLPSLSEGLPIALLEAMATPLPVVATRVGGIPEVIDGLAPLVESRNAQQLAAALTTLLSQSEAQRHALAEILHCRLTENYAIDLYRQRYRDLISELTTPTARAKI
jgi:glycosyltransferase involved in cell wall biosynthesis